MQENSQQSKDDLFDQIEAYVKNRVEIVRLTTIERLTKFLANLITDGFVFVCMTLCFIFASITFGFFLSDVFNSYTLGFACISLLYFLIALAMYLIKDKYVEKHLIDALITKIFKDNSPNGKANK